MKATILLFTACLLAIVSFGQKKKSLLVSLSTGKLTSPYYQINKAGPFYEVDFDYYLTKRHILSANFNTGKHDYYDNFLFSTPISFYENITNAQASYQTFSILYKFKFINSKAFSASIGTGAGIMTHGTTNQYKGNNSADILRESFWTDLVFPVKLDLSYKLSRRFRLGVTGGFYIQPDYPVLGYHAGPTISYVLN